MQLMMFGDWWRYHWSGLQLALDRSLSDVSDIQSVPEFDFFLLSPGNDMSDLVDTQYTLWRKATWKFSCTQKIYQSINQISIAPISPGIARLSGAHQPIIIPAID